MKSFSLLLGTLALSVSAYAQADLAVGSLDTALVATDSQTLRISGVIRATIANIGTASTAGRFRVLAFEDTNRNSRLDSATDRILGTAEYVDPISPGATPVVSIPLSGTVAFRGNLLFVLADSEGAVTESDRTNNIRSTGTPGNDGGAAYPLANFRPALKWAWAASFVSFSAVAVISTPAVVDLNRDGSPDIVFPAAYTPFSGASQETGILRALSGRNGAELFTNSSVLLNANTSIATGDIDVDGRPEIVAAEASAGGPVRLVAFEHDGTLKWRSDPVQPPSTAGISIADLDGNGEPEIIIGAQVLSSAGRLLWTGSDTSGLSVWRGRSQGPFTVAADVDLDGKVEVVAGRTVYGFDGRIRHTNPSLSDGHNAIANFNADSYPEIVHVSGGFLRLLRYDMSVIWGPVAIPGGPDGSAPTVADFDGDGQPEIAVLNGSFISLFETNGTLKFSIAVSEGSSGTSLSAFDINGDGALELMHRDEDGLNVYRGTDGTRVVNIPVTSATFQAYPVVADVDTDGRADIILQASGANKGIYVVSDLANSVAARPVWNQYGYSVTNINDDGTIPRSPTPNWLVPGLNNFRANAVTRRIQAPPAPDLSPSYIRKTDALFPTSAQLTARVGNGGGAPSSFPVGENLIQNGGFEEGCLGVSFARVSPGNPTIRPWTVVKGEVDWQSSSYPAYEGLCSLNLEGSVGAVGGIEQSFATTQGVTYEVSFRLHADIFGPPPAAPMRVSAAGTSADFQAILTNPINYVLHTWRFVATGTTTTLRFESTTTVSPGWGPVIDAVVVRATAVASNAINVSFYRGDPASGGVLLGRARTSSNLGAGEFEDVTFTWTNPPIGVQDIFVVADDPAEINEANETNNTAAARMLLGAGPFPLVDELLTRQKDSSVDLSWIAIPGAGGYNIYRRTAAGALQLIRANHTGISFTDTGLANATPVFYTVRWKNAQGVESADGTEASATPTPAGATGLNPPTISSRPVTRAVVGQLYSYQFRAGDPDAGSVLTYSLVSPPPGMAISSSGLISWTPSQNQAGYSRVQVRVQDNTARYATQAFSLFAEIQTIINNPPLISSTPIRSATSGTPYAYQVVGNDPDGSFLVWSLDAAPLGLSINQGTGLIQWTPVRDQVGTQTVTVRVTDIGGLSATQTFTIAVSRGNRGPTFISSALTVARAGEVYQYPASANDPENDPLTYSLVSGPAGMLVATTTGMVSWTVPVGAANTSVLVTLRVVDNGGLAATQAYTLRITPPNRPPVITSSAITSGAVGGNYRYQVIATDPDLPNDQLTFALTTAPSGMVIDPSSGLIQWVPPAGLVGTNQSVVVRVADLGSAQATQSFSIAVGAPGSGLPTVSLISPINGATLTEDTPMIGSATDANLRLWRVEYQRTGDTQWLPLSSGTSAVNNGSLGSFAATLLANDTYRLRLYAENSVGSITTRDIGVNVDTKQLKMGDFTLAFEDLRVPGFTFPISILRKYDSKRPQASDFGPGWTLGFSEVDVRLDPSGNAFLTLPDGRRVGFKYTPECVSPLFGACAFGAFNTVYTGQNGVYDKLQSLDCPTTVFGGCSLGGSFNPSRWLLTTKEGLKYTIDNGKVTRMEDRAGNWITIGPTGVTSSTGRNVTIERNAQGLITRISEPAPGGAMRYEYDAQGRLVRWINLSAKTTTYFYENVSFPHYLTKIVDPLGRNALRNVFNAEGRLVAQCDAAGDVDTLVGCSQFTPQPGTKTFTAINGRGFKTLLITDDRGNVLSERRFTDAVNYLETTRAYDASNNMLTERDPEGNTRTYSYDVRGNRLTEADPGGRTTTYTYATGCDKVATVRDPAGNITRNTYDEKCNLRFVQDALLKSTEYQYNSFGQRTKMIDPNGTTWTWNYLPTGLLQNVVDPLGKATTFSFDTKGNLLSRTDRNSRRIDFQYDSSNRLTRETWDNGRVSTFGYDDLGALLTAADPDSRLTMAYDNLGRLQSVDNLGTPGAPRVVMTYSYDANGNTTRVQDSLGGITDYSYDALDRLARVTQSGTGVQPKRVDMTYTAASLLSQVKRFSDLAGTQGVANTSYEYDCAGCASRLTAIRHRKASDNSVIHDMTFVRDPLGNILNSTDAEGAHTYTYDPVRRLLSATHPVGGVQPNESYTYDAVGNRLTSHLSHFYTYSWQTAGKGNRLVQDNQFDYRYDAEDNLTHKVSRATGEVLEISYDHRNRVTEIVRKNSSGVTMARTRFGFDAVNHRVSKTDETGVAFLAYVGPNAVISFDQSGAVSSRRIATLGIDVVLAEETRGRVNWILADNIGTVRTVVDNSLTVTDALIYDSFGGLLYQRNPGGSLDLTFSGRDASGFGFLNFRARTYDPRLGRFMQSDAIEPFGFIFASNNPSEFIDPLGLIEIPSYTAIATRVAAQSLPVYSRAFVVYQSGVFAAMEGYDRCKSTGGSLCEAKFIASVAVLGKLALVKNLYSGIGVPGALFSISVQWWLAEKGLPVNVLELLF